MRKTEVVLFGFIMFYSILFFAAGIKNTGSSIIIDAPVEKVWQVFYEFNEYREWNPYLKNVSGRLDPGNRIDVILKGDLTTTRKIRPVVRKNVRFAGFSWDKTTLFPGFKNESHYFDFYPISGGRTILNQYKKSIGIIVPLTQLSPEKRMMQMMNNALKERVEAIR